MNGIARLVTAALDEDIGPGDLTTEATVPADVQGAGVVLAKQALVVCGQQVGAEVIAQACARYGGEAAWEVRVPDGDRAEPGDIVASVRAPLRALIIGERVALNLMMRLSGIATHVRGFVDRAGPGAPRLVDTRKTTALHRDLEKYAVRCGGAHNHRRGLYDGVMIKDNHIAAVGSLTEAVLRVRAQVHHLVRIEVEATTLAQVSEAVDAGADVILLDNMDDALLAEAVGVARARRSDVLLEASGNMTAERVAGLAGLGLDYVSAGGLIHQARWVDLSLDVRG